MIDKILSYTSLVFLLATVFINIYAENYIAAYGFVAAMYFHALNMQFHGMFSKGE